MDLSSDSQEILKATIESAMHRTSPVGQALPSPQAPPHYMVSPSLDGGMMCCDDEGLTYLPTLSLDR